MKFPYLKKIKMKNCIISKFIELDNSYRYLESLHFVKCSFNTNLLKYIGKFSSLKDFSLSQSEFPTQLEFYDDLSNLTSLIKLDVSFTSTNTKIFMAIEKMTNLKSLNLNGCQELIYKLNTTEVAKQFSNKTYLEELQWSTCSSPYIINVISSKLTNLKILNLSSTYLDKQLVNISKNLTNLNRLYLKQTVINENFKFTLRNLSNLKSLDISLCGWTMSLLPQLIELKNLEELSISIDTIDFQIINEILLLNLKILNLSYSFASQEAITYLTRSLSLLNVQYNLYYTEISNLTSTNNFIRRHCVPLIKTNSFENSKRKQLIQ